MNGKKSKALRKAANAISKLSGKDPNKEYKTLKKVHNTLTKKEK